MDENTVYAEITRDTGDPLIVPLMVDGHWLQNPLIALTRNLEIMWDQGEMNHVWTVKLLEMEEGEAASLPEWDGWDEGGER